MSIVQSDISCGIRTLVIPSRRNKKMIPYQKRTYNIQIEETEEPDIEIPPCPIRTVKRVVLGSQTQHSLNTSIRLKKNEMNLSHSERLSSSHSSHHNVVSNNKVMVILLVLLLSTFTYCITSSEVISKDFPTSICNGHGILLSDTDAPTPRHGCSCFDGYSGSDCNIHVCFGLAANLKNVCGGRGSVCIAPDTCSNPTENSKKQGISNSSRRIHSVRASSQCSNQGEWSNGKCSCYDGFYGETCSYSNCYDSITSLTCSNRGKCIENACVCNENNMYGQRCQNTLTNNPISISTNACGPSCTKVAGVSGDAIPAEYSLLNNPTGVFVDETTGFIFFVDVDNGKVRVLARDNIVYSLASLTSPTSVGMNNQTREIYIGTRSGLFKLDKNVLTKLNSYYITGVIVNNQGHVIYSQNTNSINKIVNGTVVPVAGTGSVEYNGDNKLATTANMGNPSYLSYHSGSDTLYFVDRGNRRIRKIANNGYIYTIAGGGSNSLSNSANALTSRLQSVSDIFVGQDGTVFFSELEKFGVWKIQNSGSVTKVFDAPYGVRSLHKLVNGDIVFCEYQYYRIGIFKVASNKIVYIAGQTAVGYDPIFTADNILATLSGVNHPRSIFVRNNELFFADTYNSRVRKISSNGILTTIAGDGQERFSGNGVLGTSASLNYPYGIYLHKNGSLYIADTYNSRIRKLDLSNTITTVAGSGSFGYSDNTLPLKCSFNLAVGVVINNAGDMYISDYANNVIRKMAPSGVITTVAGQPGRAGFLDHSVARSALLNGPFGLYYKETTRDLFFADRLNNRIRKLTQKGTVETVVNNVIDPREISFHTNGNMFFTDGGEQMVKVMLSNGTISSLNMPLDYYLGLYVDSENDYLYASAYSFIYRISIGDMDHNNIEPVPLPKNCSRGCEKGDCVNGSCICKQNYGGEICDTPICFDKLSNDTKNVCSGHGVCQEPNVCYCYGLWEGEECNTCKAGFTGPNCRECVSGFGGEFCNIPICFGRFANETDVCSGRGECIGPNNCTCENNTYGIDCSLCRDGYSGDSCDVPICKGMNASDSRVCSGNGVCTFPDICACTGNWEGDECSICGGELNGTDCIQCDPGHSCDVLRCFNLTANDTRVCSGKGYCKSLDNCVCLNSWQGDICDQYCETCETPICYGVSGNDSNVCSGHGVCLSNSTCQCLNNWEGEMCQTCTIGKCETPVCYGIHATNESVCSGNGKCIDSSTCICFGNWIGPMCDHCSENYNGTDCNDPVCYGLGSNDSLVCSGHGQCTEPSTCICKGNWMGPMCESCQKGFAQDCISPLCYGINSLNESVCSGHGACIEPDHCLCETNWQGITCNECNLGFYGKSCRLTCDPNIERPVLSMKQGSTIYYTIGTTVALEPELSIPFCYTSHFTSITYRYVSHSFDQTEIVQVDKFLTVGESKTRISREGEFHFKVIATLEGLDISTPCEFIVKSQLAPLTLSFNIPDMYSQSYEQPLGFVVKGSDPSFPTDLSEGEMTLVCLNGNTKVENLYDRAVNYTISISKIFSPGSYECQALFKKDTRSTTKSIHIQIIGVPSSQLFTITLQLQDQNPGWVNPSKQITIIVITPQQLNNSAIYEWKTPLQNVDNSKSSLVIGADELSMGTVYNVSLVITDGNQKGYGFISFKTASPPTIGSFSVSPQFGYSLTTSFMLLCGNDWTAVNQAGLTYNFIYRDSGGSGWKSLVESSSKPALNTTLPAGTWEISVSVSDTLLSYSTFDKPITVQVNTTSELTISQLNYVASNPITPSIISSLLSYVNSDSSSSEVKEQSKQIVIDSIKTSLTKETVDTTLTVSSLKSAISVIDSVSSSVSAFKDSESTVVLQYFSTVLHKTLANGIQMSPEDIQLCLNSATKFEEYFFSASKRSIRKPYETSIDMVTQIYNVLTEVKYRKLKNGEIAARISSLSFYSYCIWMNPQTLSPFTDTITETSLPFSLLQSLNGSSSDLPKNSIVCLKMYYIPSWDSIVPSSYTSELALYDVNNGYSSISISRDQKIVKMTVPRMNTGVNQKQVCYKVGMSISEGCNIVSTTPLQIVIQASSTGKFFVGFHVETEPIIIPTTDDSISAFVIIFAIIVPFVICCCVCLAATLVCRCAFKKWKANAALYSHSMLKSTQSLPLPNERLDVTFEDINVYNSGINSSPSLPLYIHPGEIRIMSKLGSGGYGSVHKAYWKNQIVAVKSTILPESTTQIEIPREASLMCALKHPNIVECYGISIKGKEQLIVMEYVNGNLNQVIGDLCKKTLKMDLDEKIEILLQIATGMNYMHLFKPLPIVHRDLTPANVLYDPRTKTCKICDFGLSKPLNIESNETKNRGTIYYVPNELIYNSDTSLTSNPCAIDIYSFSILAWQLLFEDHPYLYIHKEKLFTTTKFKHTPYVDVTNDNLLSRVVTGLRPVIPFDADSVSKWTHKFMRSKFDNELIALALISITQLIQNSWNLNPHLRPSFQQVIDVLQTCKNTLSHNHPLLV